MDERRGRKPLGEEKRDKKVCLCFTEREWNDIMSTLPDPDGKLGAQLRGYILERVALEMLEKFDF